MWGMTYAMAAILAVATLVAWVVTDRVEANEAAFVSRAAGQLAVYGKHVRRYAQAHPSSTGRVSDAALGLPEWFERRDALGNAVLGGVGFVYLAPVDRAEAASIAAAFSPDVRVGVKVGGRLRLHGSQADAGVVPNVVPDGAVVVRLE